MELLSETVQSKETNEWCPVCACSQGQGSPVQVHPYEKVRGSEADSRESLPGEKRQAGMANRLLRNGACPSRRQTDGQRLRSKVGRAWDE